MSKQFWAIIAVIVLVFGGIVLFHNNKGASGNGSQPTNHVEGQGSSGVTLVEYGDYECPYCGDYYPTVKQVAGTFSSQIHFQFRNLPLTQVHPNAFAGARAAEAAGLQGKFWEMHDLLYSNQNAWVPSSNVEPIFESYARQLGLDVARFKTDYASEKVNNLINADISAFDKTGAVVQTPTFFLDGKLISPNNSVQSFMQLINAEIAKKTKAASSSSSAATTSSSNAPMQQSQQ